MDVVCVLEMLVYARVVVSVFLRCKNTSASHSVVFHAFVYRSYLGECMEGIDLTSLLPLPKPLITLPSNRSGNGDSGPLSGPTTVGRGPSGGGMVQHFGVEMVLSHCEIMRKEEEGICGMSVNKLELIALPRPTIPTSK